MATNTPHSESSELQSTNADPGGTQPLSTGETQGAPKPSELEMGVPPIISLAQAAFRRDLPKLLTERAGQWVAYQGDELIGFGATKTEVFQECLRRGLERNQFLVRSVEPEMDEIVLGLGVDE